jgi:hypothetical protein
LGPPFLPPVEGLAGVDRPRVEAVPARESSGVIDARACCKALDLSGPLDVAEELRDLAEDVVDFTEAAPALSDLADDMFAKSLSTIQVPKIQAGEVLEPKYCSDRIAACTSCASSCQTKRKTARPLGPLHYKGPKGFAKPLD